MSPSDNEEDTPNFDDYADKQNSALNYNTENMAELQHDSSCGSHCNTNNKQTNSVA
jgi:hypothetical protein